MEHKIFTASFCFQQAAAGNKEGINPRFYDLKYAFIGVEAIGPRMAGDYKQALIKARTFNGLINRHSGNKPKLWEYGEYA